MYDIKRGFRGAPESAETSGSEHISGARKSAVTGEKNGSIGGIDGASHAVEGVFDKARCLAGFPPGSIPSSYPPDGYPSDPTTGFPYAGPVIISRNLTPDKNGRPEGGRTLEEFKEILRTGKDFDNIHPTCLSDTDPNIALGVCIPPLVDGSKLQVMPWPLFHNMTDHQIEAVYEYLSTIPCIDNTFSPPPAGAPNELRNDCGGDPPLIRDDASPSHGNARANDRRYLALNNSIR